MIVSVAGDIDSLDAMNVSVEDDIDSLDDIMIVSVEGVIDDGAIEIFTIEVPGINSIIYENTFSIQDGNEKDMNT